MLDRLMLHGYGVHHAVPGRENGEVEQYWGCGLSLDGMDCWQWGGVGWMRWVLEDTLGLVLEDKLGLGLGLELGWERWLILLGQHAGHLTLIL